MRKYIVGNWKMHGAAAMAHALAEAVAAQAAALPADTQVVLCPPATLAAQLVGWLIGSRVHVGGQDCHMQPHGAFTGDISAAMLAEAGCAYVIVGHSERRQNHMETSEMVSKKAAQALAASLIPLICIGETAEERASGIAEDIVRAQLAASLPPQAANGNFLLAYEPVWAIGSGKIAEAADIARMHAVIHSALPVPAPVLYGGSVKADNAAEIMAISGVSGLLVGGASLKAEEFCKIVASSK